MSQEQTPSNFATGTVMVVPGYSFYRTKRTNNTMSTIANTTATTTRRKLVVSFVSRANEPKLRDWLAKNYGGYGHNSLRNGVFRKQVAAKATQELGFKVTERNLQSRYYKMRVRNTPATGNGYFDVTNGGNLAKPARSLQADRDAVQASLGSGAAGHVPMTSTDDVTSLKRVANEQHARITSLENQVRRLFSIARKYVPSEDISAPQSELTRPFAGV